MKKLFSLCVALAFTLILAACSGGGAPAGAYDPDATAQALLDSGAFSEALEALDADLISSLYGLESQPEAAAVYTSTGATAEEIAVLVFSTQEEADDARKALEARVSDQKDACEGYLPAELPKLEQAIVKESGSSVLLVVANDSQAAQAALDGYFLAWMVWTIFWAMGFTRSRSVSSIRFSAAAPEGRPVRLWLEERDSRSRRPWRLAST